MFHFLFSLFCFVINPPQAFLPVGVSNFKSFRYYKDTQGLRDPRGIWNIHSSTVPGKEPASLERPLSVQVGRHSADRKGRRLCQHTLPPALGSKHSGAARRSAAESKLMRIPTAAICESYWEKPTLHYLRSGPATQWKRKLKALANLRNVTAWWL